MKITHQEFEATMAEFGGDLTQMECLRIAKEKKAEAIVLQSVSEGEISAELGDVLHWLINGKR